MCLPFLVAALNNGFQKVKAVGKMGRGNSVVNLREIPGTFWEGKEDAKPGSLKHVLIFQTAAGI